MIQYGGELRTQGRATVTVERESGVTLVTVAHEDRRLLAAVRMTLRMTYPQLLSLITRLQEAAKDAAKEPR